MNARKRENALDTMESKKKRKKVAFLIFSHVVPTNRISLYCTVLFLQESTEPFLRRMDPFESVSITEFKGRG